MSMQTSCDANNTNQRQNHLEEHLSLTDVSIRAPRRLRRTCCGVVSINFFLILI